MDVRELAWAAGLFEGEGCISLSRPTGTKICYPAVTLAMNDEDVVRRFHAAVGVGTVVHGRLWKWGANSFENGQAVVALLWFGLGARRRARAAEVMRVVRESQSERKYFKRPDECINGGCDRAVWARGRCNMHYLRANYDRRKDALNARRRAARAP